MSGNTSFPFKPLLDVLNPLVSPQATHQEKLDAIRALKEPLWYYDATEGAEGLADAFLSLDGVPILKPYLQDGDDDAVLETLMIMRGIACSHAEYGEVLLEHGIHEDFGRLLEHTCVDAVKHAIVGLGDIALDCAANRDAVLRCGVANRLRTVFERSETSQDLRKQIFWTILNLCKGSPRPNDLYLVPIYRTLRTALSSLADNGLGGEENPWFHNALLTLSNLSDGGVHNVQRCLDFDLPQLVLKLCMQVPAKLPEVSATEVVPRRVASEQLGEVLSYLPHPDLVRLCAVSKDVLIASVCDHKEVYRRLRPNHILATPSLRLEAIHIISNLLSCDDANQTAAGLSHGAVTVLEDLTVLSDLSEGEKYQVFCIFSNLAACSENQVFTNSDVFLDFIGIPLLSTKAEDSMIFATSSELVKWRDAGVLASLLTKSERFVDKVFIPAIAKCLFESMGPLLSFLHRVFDAKLSLTQKAAIERRIELNGLGQRKQQEQLSIVDALWDRDTRARRLEASVEDIARRLRVYWGFLQSCCEEARRQGEGGGIRNNACLECGPCLGFDEGVFLLYQEIYEAIDLLDRKRGRED